MCIWFSVVGGLDTHFYPSISDKATEADAAVAKALGAAPAAEFANVNKWLAEVK